MKFFFAALVLMFIGRKVGWGLSRGLLYQTSVPAATVISLLWGAATAGCIYYLIDWGSPGVILRWVMGYALGAYISIPNFGLVDDGSIPPHAQIQHMLISNVPLLVYIAATITFSFVFPHIHEFSAQ